MKKLFLAATLVALGATAFLALAVTPPRENQGEEAVRLLYLHVPLSTHAPDGSGRPCPSP